MVLDACRRHGLWMGDIRIVSIDKDACIRNILGQEVSRPKLAIAVCPCLERMIISTAWVQAMNEDKTKQLLRKGLGLGFSVHTRPCVIQEERIPPARRETHIPGLCLESCLVIDRTQGLPF